MKKTSKSVASQAGKLLNMDDHEMMKYAGIESIGADPMKLSKFFSEVRAVCASDLAQREVRARAR